MKKKRPPKKAKPSTPSRGWIKRFNHRIWPVVFWGWAILITIWLFAFARTSVETAPTASTRFSQLVFNDFQLEQLDRAENRVQVRSDYAYLDPIENAFKLYRPDITWQSAAGDSVFSASAERGSFAAEGESTELPSEFTRMELTGVAHASNGNMAVDSDSLIFDNENRIFYIPPGEFGLQREGFTMPKQQTTGIYFDPIQGNGKMSQNLDDLLSTRSQNETQ